MTRSRIIAALVGLGIIVAPATAALAQTYPPPVVVPAPSASPGTVVVPPSASGTTVVAPPGSTVIVQPPPTTTTVVPVRPWCGGAYASPGGTNFGGCGSR